MIIITGATGHLGGAIVERLLERVPASGIGISVRDPEKTNGLAARGVRVRRGDYADPESLRHAFEGASQVLIVSSDARARGGDPLAQHRNAIDAAKAVRAGRVLYTSHMAASASSRFPPMRDHAETEAMLQGAEIAFTAFRNGFYASTVPRLLGDAFETGRLVAPQDGPVSWTTHADLAEGIAAVLADEGRFEGATPPLTGAEALDLADVARIASEIAGRRIERLTLMDDDFRAGMTARGFPEVVANISLGLFAAARAGEFATVDPTLEGLLGRHTTPLRDVLADRPRH